MDLQKKTTLFYISFSGIICNTRFPMRPTKESKQESIFFQVVSSLGVISQG